MEEFSHRNQRGGFLSSFIPQHIDWVLIGAITPLLLFGLITMNSFVADNTFFFKQLIWIAVSLTIFFGISFIDFHFLRRTKVLVALYGIVVFLLILLYGVAHEVKGAKSWFDLGFASFQPTDLAKLVLILVLAKYFSRRHIEIARSKHVLISGAYAFILFVLILIQPALGSAIIIFCIWLGMVLVAGISKKHLAIIFTTAIVSFSLLWGYGLAEYQKNRIISFIHPLADIHGAGYHAYQAMIAVGSGQMFGKGIGYGTQSKLQFLPEYHTDFIFAAFAEEWGFFGVLMLIGFYGVVVWRIIKNGLEGESNFETLYAVGLAIFFVTHFIVHVGINVGLLPVTGTTIPFVSYGGSHLIVEFTGLGILMGMRRYNRPVHKSEVGREFFGV
jgi:rod shape determining protein RodA